MGKPAQQLTRAIRDYLHTQGWITWANRSGAIKLSDRFVRFQNPGLPDVMALRNGRLLCVEVKAGADRLTVHQAAWLNAAELAGAIVVVARDVQDVINKLNGKGRR